MPSETARPISTPTPMPARKLPSDRLRVGVIDRVLAIYIFSGALTPRSDSPLASVCRAAAHSASRAARASSSTRMRSAL